MGKYSMTNLIAFREYVWTRDGKRTTIRAELGIPVPAPDLPDDWYCPWNVVQDSRPHVSYAVGVDSFQALLMAVSGLRSILQQFADKGDLVCFEGLRGPDLHLVP